MKKTLIAIAALAAVGTAAAQQSSVTMYGIVDTAYGYVEDSYTNKVTGVKVKDRTIGFRSGVISTSRLGFKGQEALGNGLSAVFALEMGFNAANGSTDKGFEGFNRRSVVGLKGSFGEVLIGRDSFPLNVWDGQYQAIDATIDDMRIGTRGTGLFYNGTFDGLTVNAVVGYDENKQSVSNGVDYASRSTHNAAYGLGVHYTNGAFGIGAAVQGFSTADSKSPKNPEFGIGAYYDFTAAKVFAHYLGVRAKDVDGTIGLKQERDQFGVGVAVPFGATTLSAEYAYNHLKEKENGFRLPSATGHDFAVQAQYAFSKRTSAYARFAQVDVWGNEYFKSKTEKLGVGVKHTF